jgi:hypothetical protein
LIFVADLSNLRSLALDYNSLTFIQSFNYIHLRRFISTTKFSNFLKRTILRNIKNQFKSTMIFTLFDTTKF